jgi:uncharacterized protein (DUF58 family)
MSLLPEESAASLARLELLARHKKEGTINGRHRSPAKGTSVEFAEHRDYSPGDDLRNLDWRIYAKSDRHHIKQFVEETNLRCTLVVDASGSMSYTGNSSITIRGQRVSKFDYARYLAASLSHLLIGQRDATGLVTFDSRVRDYLRPASKPSQIRQLLDTLHRTKPGGETGVAVSLHEVAKRIPPRGLVFLISDLFDDPDALAEALHHFSYRKHELVVIHVMADEELTFPFDRFSDFHDLEPNGGRLQIDPGAIKADYLERVRNFVNHVETTCGNLHADYIPANTRSPYTEVLNEYLNRK